jgi:tRNA pseudouridine38-40 synthase
MARFRLDIEYDGRPFAGWQQAIEDAIFRFTTERVSIRGAGRTDTGVHATGQVAHVDLARDWAADKLMGALNAHLRLAGDPIAVFAVEAVSEDFDARFSATSRNYLFRILNRRAPAALDLGRVWHVILDVEPETRHHISEKAAAQTLLGRHDFTTFRSVQCQANSPVRTLDRLEVTRSGEIVEIRASARSFLHNQVRSMVGTLKKAGEGAWTVEDVRAALDAADRSRCGQVAPPDGLFLTRVDYD